MPDFTYRRIKRMEPRIGRKYSTEYYQQTPKEYERTRQFVERTIEQMIAIAQEDPRGLAALAEPLKQFPRRETAGYYSAADIMGDMLDQLTAGRDIASGLLNRWNRLFDNTGYELVLLPENTQTAESQYTRFFKD